MSERMTGRMSDSITGRMNERANDSVNASASTPHALTGRLVRLAAFDPETDSEYMARWSQDSEYQQLLDSGPAHLHGPKEFQEWMEKHLDEMCAFSIRSLENDQRIGLCTLDGFDWTARSAWVSIGIGERAYWGKGYGTDAMDQLMRFAFEQLNLRRVNLDVFEYNPRAYQSYRKVGFKEEGRLRQWMQRAGERYDLIFMGILSEEWQEKHLQAISQPEEK